MKHDGVNYVLVGGFLIGITIAFLFVAQLISGRSGKMDRYYVCYDNVGGIKKGTPITYKGYLLGKVHAMQASQFTKVPCRQNDGKISSDGQQKTTFYIDLDVASGWKIPTDSIAKVRISGLMNKVTIDILEGKSNKYLQPGAILQGREAVDLFSAMGSMATEVGSLTTDSIKPLLRVVHRGVNVLMGHLETSTPRILADIESLTHQLSDNKIFVNVESALARLTEIIKVVEEDILGTENRRHLQQALIDLQQTTDAVKKFVPKIEHTRVKIDSIMTSSQSIITENRDDMKRSLTSMRLSLETVSNRIDTIINNLDGTSRNFNAFSRQLRRNPAGTLLGGSRVPPDPKR